MTKTIVISGSKVRTSPDNRKSIGDVDRARSIDPVICEDGLTRPPWAAHDPLLRAYYDTEWGMPICDERGLFERLSLEAFQPGLSWATILRKRESLRQAFELFEAD
ncbi:hypothetical protein PBS_02510 [Paraburkholderia sp. 2C]